MASSLSIRAQVSTVDYIVGFLILIFTFILVSEALLSFQQPSSFAPVKQQAFVVSDYLVSEGIPSHWNENSSNLSTILVPGLVSQGALDKPKLQALSTLPYNFSRSRLAGTFQWYAYVLNATSILNLSSTGSGCGLGYPLPTDPLTCQPSFPSSSQRASVTRLLAYNGSIVRLQLALVQ